MERQSWFYAAAVGSSIWVWVLVCAVSGEKEAWDSPWYMVVGMPVVCAVAAGLGYVEPARPWRWGLLSTMAQAVWMFATQGFGNLWLLGVGFFLLLVVRISGHDLGVDMSRHSSDLPKAAAETLRRGNLVEAIRIVSRERHVSFKEAKAQVEVYIGSQPALKKKMDKILVDAQRKFIRWIVGFLVLAAGVTYIVMQKLGT